MNDPRREHLRPPGIPRKADRIESIDWLALWALSIGFSAMVIAALGVFTARDPVGSAYVLAGAAVIIALVLGFSRAPGRP